MAISKRRKSKRSPLIRAIPWGIALIEAAHAPNEGVGVDGVREPAEHLRRAPATIVSVTR